MAPVECRAVIRFLYLKGRTPTETCDELKAIYGEDASYSYMTFLKTGMINEVVNSKLNVVASSHKWSSDEPADRPPLRTSSPGRHVHCHIVLIIPVPSLAPFCPLYFFPCLPMLSSLSIPYLPLILSSSFPSLSHSLTIPSDPLLSQPFPLLYVPYISSHSFPSPTSLLIHFHPFHPFSSFPIPSLPILPASLPSRSSQSLQYFQSLPIPFDILPSLPIPCHPHPFRSLIIPSLPIP